jgi:hypothetical protein
MTDCPKFAKMQKMFHGKFVAIIEVQLLVKTQTITSNVNVMDVNVTMRSKVIEEQVFKDREPKKAKSDVDWEKKKTVERINGGNNSIDSKNTNLDRMAIHIHGGWNKTWLSMPNTNHVETQKYQEVVNSQEKLITIEEISLGIGK